MSGKEKLRPAGFAFARGMNEKMGPVPSGEPRQAGRDPVLPRTIGPSGFPVVHGYTRGRTLDPTGYHPGEPDSGVVLRPCPVEDGDLPAGVTVARCCAPRYDSIDLRSLLATMTSPS